MEAFVISRCKLTHKHGTFPRCLRSNHKKVEYATNTTHKSTSTAGTELAGDVTRFAFLVMMFEQSYFACTCFSLCRLFSRGRILQRSCNMCPIVCHITAMAFWLTAALRLPYGCIFRNAQNYFVQPYNRRRWLTRSKINESQHTLQNQITQYFCGNKCIKCIDCIINDLNIK